MKGKYFIFVYENKTCKFKFIDNQEIDRNSNLISNKLINMAISHFKKITS